VVDRSEQRRKAEEFLALHSSDELLILPNAWDVASKEIFEREGFKAIGTTSAGVAATLGHADGEKMTLADNLQVVQRIVDSTSLPVSADMESGYADSVGGIARTAEAVLASGAVGLNIEDSTVDSDTPLFDKAHQQDKIRAIRAVANASEVHLLINARTDVFLVDGDEKSRLSRTIERGNSYREAGADCIFVPDVGNLDKSCMEVLVREIDAPLNVIAGATTPAVAELQDIGVARLSLGPRPMRALFDLLRSMARELIASGTYGQMASPVISYDEVNGWFS
jgi:2-methylisocitrate lyase-like PEP mutase family enzyme